MKLLVGPMLDQLGKHGADGAPTALLLLSRLPQIEAERATHRTKIFIVGHENSEYGVEWMRLEADAPIPESFRQAPHVAFEVRDLASELAGREILIAPNNPSAGVRVAFIVENGAPIRVPRIYRTEPSGSALRRGLESKWFRRAAPRILTTLNRFRQPHPTHPGQRRFQGVQRNFSLLSKLPRFSRINKDRPPRFIPCHKLLHVL
jgi:hypothetical protein